MHAELAEVRRALENQELVPFFQPLVELRTGQLAGFEVLARWQHPQLGPILPEDFIALAEQNGLIGKLMEQVLEKAFLCAPNLPEPLALAINVSPSQWQDLELPAQILKAAGKANFSPTRLTIEITESALFNNLNKAKTIAHELKTAGCRLALDDFGTGYSSLAHLQALPFDELKIDRSFVSSMAKTRESRKIVAAIVGLGHSLGLITVAEGVETEQQADMLLWLGCEVGQGWLYGKAVPADEITNFIAAKPRRISEGISTPGDDWAVSSLEALPTQRLAQLQAIYDGAPVGLAFLDRNLRYVSINRILAELNGAPVAAHIGKTVQQMIPASYVRFEPYLLRALHGEPITDVEVSRPSNIPGGLDWIARASYQPAFDEADEVIGISVAVSDVTESKRLEDALRESDERQQNIQAKVPWIMDAEGNSLFVSSSWVQTTSLSRKAMRNLGWLEPLHSDDLERIMKTMKDSLRTGKPIDIEYRVMSIDGEWRWMRSRGSPRFGPSGEIIRWYGSVEDIHEERKQLAETSQ
jgi:PAS domain S-box-containing protein